MIHRSLATVFTLAVLAMANAAPTDLPNELELDVFEHPFYSNFEFVTNFTMTTNIVASYKQGNNQVLISDMTSAGKPFMLTKTYKLNSFAVQYSKFSTFVEDCKVVDKNVEFDKVKKNIATQIVKGLKFLATNPNPTANAFVDLKTLTVSAQKQGDLLKESKVDFKPNFIESKFGVAIPEGVFDLPAKCRELLN